MTALGNGLAARESKGGRHQGRMIPRTQSNSVDEVSIIKAEKLGGGPRWKYFLGRGPRGGCFVCL